MDKYAEQALLEYNSAETSPHLGGADGKPFWNINSTQFMFAPVLKFPEGPKGCLYLYTAKDESEKLHSFKSATQQMQSLFFKQVKKPLYFTRKMIKELHTLEFFSNDLLNELSNHAGFIESEENLSFFMLLKRISDE